jgi:glyoxylase-like metal-dependent hydrolase (beta-lactamase superfamily II)
VTDDPYAPLAAERIHRLALPTPFAVGRVNVYLIEDDPLTLVDSGPNSGSTLDELQRALERVGHAIEEIELILITHQHLDHIGLVQIIANHSGADVAGIEQLVPFVENYREAAAADDDFGTSIMRRYGIPEDVVTALESVSRAFRAWGARADVTRTLRAGERLELRDRKLEVLFRPGHSPTDTVFLDAERRLLIGGDHLIKHISSNPLIARRPIDGHRERSLVNYLESLKLTRELPIDLVLPGHGDPIHDHRELIDNRLRLHARRAEKIYGLIAERPRNAYEIAQMLWGNVAVTQAFLTLSEVLGHTDMLLEQGRIAEVEDTNGVVRFDAAAVAA